MLVSLEVLGVPWKTSGFPLYLGSWKTLASMKDPIVPGGLWFSGLIQVSLVDFCFSGKYRSSGNNPMYLVELGDSHDPCVPSFLIILEYPDVHGGDKCFWRTTVFLKDHGVPGGDWHLKWIPMSLVDLCLPS